MKYLISPCSNNPSPIHATIPWRKQAVGTIDCPECCRINPAWWPKPIDIFLLELPRGIIGGGVSFTSACVYHRDFIRQIYDYLDDSVIGKCFDKDGKLIEEYVTCYSLKPINKRAGKGTEYRICNTCGTIRLHRWDLPYYVLRDYLTGAKVYQDYSCFMYLDESLAKEIDFSPWPDTDLDKVRIVEKPLDDYWLPCDPPDAPWREKSMVIDFGLYNSR